jgi:hypothetical protein
LTEREVEVDALVQLLRAKAEYPRRTSVKRDVIRLLGELRAERAVEYLVTNVAFYYPDVWENYALADYPAAIALTNIGYPSVKGIINQLIHPTTEEELKLFAWVIISIEGAERAAVGLFRLEHELDIQRQDRITKEKQRGIHGTETEQERNLARLINVYKGIDPKNVKDWPRMRNGDRGLEKK